MTGMVRDMTPDRRAHEGRAGAGYATATDLADWLVRTLKMPFREAHHVTGRIVGLASRAGRRAGGAVARRDAERRAAHHRGRLRRAGRRELGEEPHHLRRHGAGQCARAGEGVAGAACRCLRRGEGSRQRRCFSASPRIARAPAIAVGPDQAAGAKFRAADKALNLAYDKLLDKISPARHKALIGAQRIWIRFRDEECDFETMGESSAAPSILWRSRSAGPG